MAPNWLSPTSTGARLAVQITPNARKSEVVGVHGDALKIKLQAQPIEGRANEALIRFLAERLNIPRGAIIITHGHTNRLKLIAISSPGLTPEQLVQALFPETNQRS